MKDEKETFYPASEVKVTIDAPYTIRWHSVAAGDMPENGQECVLFSEAGLYEFGQYCEEYNGWYGEELFHTPIGDNDPFTKITQWHEVLSRPE